MLFQDKPEITELKFAHSAVVEWLKGTIAEVKTPFRLGLVGDLGTGKSTIIRETLHRMQKDNTDLRIAYVDVWKLDKESARRSALLKIAKDLKVNPKKQTKLKESLYGVISDVSEHEPFSRFADWPAILITLGLSIALGAIVYFALGATALEMEGWAKIFTAFSVAVFSATTRFLEKSFYYIHKSISRSPLVGAEEFEESLKTILEEPHLKEKKFIFVFDNIDRATEVQAQEILTGISAFFDHSHEDSIWNVIILVPHAKRTGFGLTTETSQKVFDAVIPLPQIVPDDLIDFTAGLLKQNGDWDQVAIEVSQLICFGPISTPRQIKHFLNRLFSLFDLAKNMESQSLDSNSDSFLSKGLVTSNQITFSKILVCEEIWSGFLDWGIKNNLTLEKLFNASTFSDKTKFSSVDRESIERLVDFLNATIDLPRNPPPIPAPFKYFKGADTLLLIPNGTALENALFMNQKEPIADYIKTKSNYDNLYKVTEYVVKKHWKHPQALKNIFTALLSAVDDPIDHEPFRNQLAEWLCEKKDLLEKIPIPLLKKVTPYTETSVENSRIWSVLDARFRAYTKPEEERELATWKSWHIDYLCEVLKQPNGVKRSQLDQNQLSLGVLASEEVHATLNGTYPKEIVSSDNFFGSINSAAEQSFIPSSMNQLLAIISAGLQNINHQSKANFDDSLQKIAASLNTHMAKSDFGSNNFVGLCDLIRILPNDKRCPEASWKTIGNQLEGMHGQLQNKIKSGLRAEVCLLLVTLDQKTPITQYANLKAKLDEIASGVTVEDIETLEKVAHDSIDWSDRLAKHSHAQLIARMNDQEVFAKLFSIAHGTLAQQIQTNWSKFVNLDNFLEVLEVYVPKKQDSINFDTFLANVMSDPSKFKPEDRLKLLKIAKDRTTNFESITEKFIEYDFNNPSLGLTDSLISWLKESRPQKLEELSERAKKYLVDNSPTNWTEKEASQFKLSLHDKSTPTEDYLKQLLDIGIERGIKGGATEDVCKTVAAEILGIWELNRIVEEDYLDRFQKHVAKCQFLSGEISEIDFKVEGIKEKAGIKDSLVKKAKKVAESFVDRDE